LASTTNISGRLAGAGRDRRATAAAGVSADRHLSRLLGEDDVECSFARLGRVCDGLRHDVGVAVAAPQMHHPVAERDHREIVARGDIEHMDELGLGPGGRHADLANGEPRRRAAANVVPAVANFRARYRRRA
jgi:hypothetical protein